MGNEMGNNNTSALKEEDSTCEAQKKFLEGHVHEDGVNEENQIIPAAQDSDADPKAAGLAYDDASELGIETLQEDSNPSNIRGENQPNVEAKDVMEKAAADITFELGRDTLQEDNHGDQTSPVAEAEDAKVKAIVLASENTTSRLENEPLEGDSDGDDVTVRNQLYPIAEADEVQGKATGLASENIESILGKEPVDEDAHQHILNEENLLNARAEDVDIQEKSAEQDSDNATSTLEKDPLERDSHVADVNTEHQINPGTASLTLDSKACELQEDTDANEKQGENDMHPIAKGTDVQENAIHLASNDPVNEEDCFGYKVEDMIEVTQDKSSIAGSVEPRSETENYGIFPRLEFEGTEEHEKQKEPSLKKNDPIRNDCHLDKESSTKQEEQDTTFSNDAELQESSNMVSNHDDCAKIFPEPLLPEIESQKRTDFLDTSFHCQKDKDDVLGENMDFQEKLLRMDESNGRDGGAFVNGLRDKSGGTPDSPNVDSKTNGALESNGITDNSLNLVHESAVVEIRPDHEEKGRTEPKVENSHDYNPGHCSEVPLKEFKDDVANGTFDEERNIVGAFNAYVHSSGNQVDEPKETQNGHQLDECVNNHKKASDEVSKDFMVPEVEPDPLIAESTVADCRYGDDVNNKKRMVEEMDEKSEASCVTVKSNEGEEILEECNFNLVTLDQEESVTVHISASSSSSLLHIYDFQQENVNQKTFTATIMPSSDSEQASDKSFGAIVDKKDTSNLTVPTLDSVADEALDKEGKDSSHQLEATSAANPSGESYPVISPIANGGCEGMGSITRLSTESNPDISIISSQMQKSPSFNINLRIEAKSEESDQIPLLSREKTTTGNLSNQTNHGNINSIFNPEYDQCMIKNEEVEIEEKVVTMERSYSEKSKAPFIGLLKEEEEAHLLVKPQKESSNGGGTKKAVKEVPSTSAKGEEKRKPKPSFFSSCMCCATVLN